MERMPCSHKFSEQGILVPAPCAAATSRTIRTPAIVKALDIASLHKMTLIRSCELVHALTPATVVLTHTEQGRTNHNIFAQLSF